MNLKNKRIAQDQFLEMREEVIKEWPTATEIKFEEVFDYYKSFPAKKFVKNKLLEAKDNNKVLIQPRIGNVFINEFVKELNFLHSKGGADILSANIDRYTRQNKYKEAEKGIKESKERGRPMLKGFPAINHGVDKCRNIVESISVPMQVRHGTPDARLLAEVTLAGGFSDFEGGGISYNLSYAKKISLEKTIRYWQYIDRLVAYYEENGVSFNREFFGPLTGNLVPPAISITINIIEALFAAEQGVKYMSLGYAQNGNLLQDIAAIKNLSTLTNKYLNKEGYNNIELTTVFHQWLGGFPKNEAKAYAIINLGATTAALSGATKVVVKSPKEALGRAQKEDIVAGLKSTKHTILMLAGQSIEDSEILEKEKKMQKREVEEILNRVFELGEGDLVKGVIAAFKEGVLDIPFSPSKYNKGEMVPARDINGAVRYLNFGNLPFSKEVKKFHQEKMKKRAEKENREVDFQMAIDDIYEIGKGLIKVQK
ncbi:MAG: methylaspartate mutase subunit E [Bacillota bacterium]